MLETHLGFFNGSSAAAVRSPVNGSAVALLGYPSQDQDSETSESPKIHIQPSSSPSYPPEHQRLTAKQSSFSVEALLKDEKRSASRSPVDFPNDNHMFGSALMQGLMPRVCTYNSIFVPNKFDFEASTSSSSNITNYQDAYFSKCNQNPLCSLREWSEQQARFGRSGLPFGHNSLLPRQQSANDLKFSVQSILSNNQFGIPKCGLTGQFKPRGKLCSFINHVYPH